MPEQLSLLFAAPEVPTPPAPLLTPTGRRSRKSPPIPCAGPEGFGCPRPGCPGDAERVVVYRKDAAPVVRLLCNWCWMTERSASPFPCSACGKVERYVKEYSRWWHLSGSNPIRDVCGDCLKPLPGVCMDCTSSERWTKLTDGELAVYPGDCACPRAPSGPADGDATAR